MEGSGDYNELSGFRDQSQLPGSNLPGYFVYLSLEFKLVSTLIIVLMASWMFFTIKTTRKLYKPYNMSS